MPRNSSKQFSLPAGSLAQPNTTVRSAPYNTAMQDVAADLNTPRPVSAGGTGVTSAAAVREVFGAVSLDDIAAMFRGLVMPFPMETPPAGWLVCNGQAVSRTTYAALFALIGTTHGAGDGATTFNLPDCRGQFVRGLDLGRGVDTGRALGSTQADDIKSHTHTGSASEAGSHTHSYNVIGLSSGGVQLASGSGWGPVAAADTTSSAGGHTHTLSVSSAGGTESRPKNIALVWAIKF